VAFVLVFVDFALSWYVLANNENKRADLDALGQFALCLRFLDDDIRHVFPLFLCLA